MAFFLVFVAAFSLAFGLTPLVRQFARRYGFIDVPHQARHTHTQPTPRLGGAGLYLAFVIVVALTLPFPRQDPQELIRLVGVLLGASLMLLVGAYDDRWELAAAPQILAQFVAAAIAIAFGVVIWQVPNPFGAPLDFPPLLAVAFTLFWLMGMMTTVNWLDGLDGLATGAVIIASAILFFHTFRLGQDSLALLPAALAGCALGFLPYNFHPARLFLGSSGAYFLGFALGTLAIIGGAKMATTLLVLGIPILDVAWLILSRLRRGRSPWLADRAHLHHRLYDLGLSQRWVVLIYYLLCAVFGLLALALPTRLYKLYALLGMGLIALVVLVVVARQRGEEGRRGQRGSA
jgi:UDP-GlcNAc:undecaprenyl-phosphate GlcNAc-1-phosphate transferase